MLSAIRAEMSEHLSMAYNSLLDDMQTPLEAGRKAAVRGKEGSR